MIITGELRSFFHERVHPLFIEWLEELGKCYELYIVCVVNEESILYDKFTFLGDLCKRYSVIEFDRSLLRLPSDGVVEKIHEEMKNTGVYEEYAKEVKDVRKILTSFQSQKKQLEVGIQELTDYGVKIDKYLKTRFDLIHRVKLVPYSNAHTLFPHSAEIEQIQMELLRRAGFHSVESYIEFAKTQSLTELRIPYELWQLNFGGPYYYNKDIFDTNDKLWCSNDFVIIGKADVFHRYCKSNLFEDPDLWIETAKKTGHKHILSHESLLVLHMYSVGITPILLLNSYNIYIQR